MLDSTLPALPESHMISRSLSLVQLLQAELPSPAPAAFFLISFANICHTSFITLKTTLRARFLNQCQSHLQGNPRQAGTGTQSFLLVWNATVLFTLNSHPLHLVLNLQDQYLL